MYEIVLYSFLLISSLLALWFSCDLAVKYSVQTAAKFKFTTLFVGFVLIAIATSLPELFVVIVSIIEQVQGISAGTIFGANLCNVSFVLSLAILLGTSIKINKKECKDSILLLLVVVSAMIIVFLLGILTKITGLILILIYFISIWWLWKNSTKKEIRKEEVEQEKIVADGDVFLKTKWGILLKLFGSMIFILIFSEIAVRIAIQFTKLLKLSLETVGATIIAIGTTLPELSLSLNAVRKKEYALSLGNIIGSCLGNGTLLLGLLIFASPKAIDIRPLRGIVPFMLISFFIIGFGIIRKKKIGKIDALIMLVLFIVYLFYQIHWVG